MVLSYSAIMSNLTDSLEMPRLRVVVATIIINIVAVALLATLAILARWSATRLADSPEGVLEFEEAAEPAVFVLDLHRDGVTPIAPPRESGAQEAR